MYKSNFSSSITWKREFCLITHRWNSTPTSKSTHVQLTKHWRLFTPLTKQHFGSCVTVCCCMSSCITACCCMSSCMTACCCMSSCITACCCMSSCTTACCCSLVPGHRGSIVRHQVPGRRVVVLPQRQRDRRRHSLLVLVPRRRRLHRPAHRLHPHTHRDYQSATLASRDVTAVIIRRLKIFYAF